MEQSNLDILQPLGQDFVNDVRSHFSPLQSEVAARNKQAQDNDQYVYGELLERMLDIPVGHDFTPVNWLRRTVEIHRSQFMGKGFGVDSSYQAEDISDSGADDQNVVGNPQLKQAAEANKQRIIIENEKRKAFAETRKQIIQQIIRDNGGDSLWAGLAENASVTGTSVVKAWFDDEQKKYILQPIEIIDNFYALWAQDDYRRHTAVAYVYQIDKQDAIRRYGVPEEVATSPLGSPLVVLSSSSITQYMSSQPMVTIMEVTGKIEGWKTSETGVLQRCRIGQETEVNVITVGNLVYQVLYKPEDVPKYYILPNKRQRRRPWGAPDITRAAININLTYIEALSDWRTVASKVNFPKFKGFGFPTGIQPPKPKARTVEILPLSAGQDIQPMVMGQSAGLGETDFRNQLNEMETQFVREVGISRQLFDMPDMSSNSNPATLTAMKSISDIVATKRALWEPILRDIFTDALTVLAKKLPNVANVVSDDEDWFVKISWPSALNADDPTYHALNLNEFNAGLLSIQTYHERMNSDKQELDRIREEMEDPLTAGIHGHILSEIAQYKLIPFGTPLPPKVNVNLRGDMTPEQEGNIAAQRGFNDGPYGTSAGPQGNKGLTAQDDAANGKYLSGGTPGAVAHNLQPNGQPAMANPQQSPQGGAPQPPSASQSIQGGGGFTANGSTPQPEMINGPTSNAPGAGVSSQPGSGAPTTSAMGKMKQRNSRKGK